MEWAAAELPLAVQADLVGVSRASLYYRPVAPLPEEVALKHRIDEIYTRYPFYGSRRMAVHLRRDGVALNRKAVQRHMREMGIADLAPGPHTSTATPDHPVYPYLLRHTTSAYPNHVWGIDCLATIRVAGGDTYNCRSRWSAMCSSWPTS